MLNRTQQNRELAAVLFKKLFLELPTQLQQLEQAQAMQELQQAQVVVHKLHGTMSFCGFTELQELAYQMEISLLSADFSQAKPAFLQLQQKVAVLQSLQEKIFQLLEK